MKLTRKQFSKIKKFSKQKIKKNDGWHRLSHVEQTVKNAAWLAKKEKADVNKCIVAAWLHDIVKHNKKKDHGNEGAKIARTFLKKLSFAKKDINDISYIMQQHNKGGKKKIKEAAVLWDSDKLQGAGASGILRTHGFYAALTKDADQAWNGYLKEIRFFKSRFYTKTAKAIIKRKSKFVKNFISTYKKEKNLNFN